MPVPSLIFLNNEQAYKNYFCNKYCAPGCIIRSFDGITVKFFDYQFKHAFFKSTNRRNPQKDCFDMRRAQRIDWIKYVIENSNMENYKRIMPNRKSRRIMLDSSTKYAVIIQIENNKQFARFITAYLVDSSAALAKMRSNPAW